MPTNTYSRNKSGPYSNPYAMSAQEPGQYDYFSMDQPSRPDYTPAYNPGTMSLKDTVDQDIGGINLNTRGLDAYREQALRTGPSAWGKMATANENANETLAKDSARSQGAAKEADSEANLAARGGMDSGARTSLQRSANHNYLDMSQQIGANAQKNRNQISMNDEQNRISQLGALPGMENQALQPQFEKAKMDAAGGQFDIGNLINEGNNRNLFNLNDYHEQMQAWGANQQAKATENAGKK